MALIPCPGCSKTISENAGKCSNCGYVLTPEEIAGIHKHWKQVDKNWRIGCLSVIAIILIAAMFGPSNKDSNTSSDSPSSKDLSTYSEVTQCYTSPWSVLVTYSGPIEDTEIKINGTHYGPGGYKWTGTLKEARNEIPLTGFVDEDGKIFNPIRCY